MTLELKFTVSAHISRPMAEVFEAVVDPDRLSRYFATGSAKGRIEAGAVVTWSFHDFPGAFPVQVIAVEPERRIVLEWGSHEAEGGEVEGQAEIGPSRTRVEIAFEPIGPDRTLVTISESGWKPTQAGLKASYGNCHGWTQMLCALKAFIEHGVVLRQDMYR